MASAIAEYEKRAERYWPLDIREVKAVASGTREVVIAREGERLLEAASDAMVVLCDETGKPYQSRKFAGWLHALRVEARDVAFLIGGAFGVSEALRQAAQHTLALAPWTLPHEIARLVLAEQLYRAGTILRGEPYHK